MQRQTVSSSNINSIGYGGDSQVLEIQFNDGSIYQYDNVPARIYHDLISADSKGSYFYRNIRKKFPYKKVN